MKVLLAINHHEITGQGSMRAWRVFAFPMYAYFHSSEKHMSCERRVCVHVPSVKVRRGKANDARGGR